MHSVSPSVRVLPGSVSQNAMPTKPILKTASILGRRKHQPQEDSDTLEASGSPKKRLKVVIDRIDNVTHEIDRHTMVNVKLEVKAALEDYLRVDGNKDQCQTFKKMFADDTQESIAYVSDKEEETVKPRELRVYIIALAGCVHILKYEQCKDLVRAILQCSWLGRDDAFLEIFIHFLSALVSAKGSYLTMVLAMIVDKFRLTRQSSWCVPGFPQVSRDLMRQRLFFALQYLGRTFPLAVGVLKDMLRDRFPTAIDSAQIFVAYINNLLMAKDYLPDLRREVFDTILSHAVKIDVQMHLDLEDTTDNVTAAVLLALSENSHDTSDWEGDELCESDTESIDGDAKLVDSDNELVDSDNELVDSDVDSDNESTDNNDDSDVDEVAIKVKTITKNVEKLDAVLDTLFKFYSPFFLNPGSDNAFDTFSLMLREFEQIVLPSGGSRHTQFLIFHFAQQHERLTDAFCGQLIVTAFQKSNTSYLKQAAAAYLASFVARGAQVPRDMVRTIFTLLLHHIEQYQRKFEPIYEYPDLKRFYLYYSLMQAALYIFCFRWQDLVTAAPDDVDTDDMTSYFGQNLEWIGSSRKDLSNQIYSKLNPLMVCAPVIVEEFTKLAHRLNFMYVYPLIESNERGKHQAPPLSHIEDEEITFQQLDLCFPFDPYQLPVSKRWLDGEYVQWRSISDFSAEEDSDDDGQDADDVDEDGFEEGTATDSDGDD